MGVLQGLDIDCADRHFTPPCVLGHMRFVGECFWSMQPIAFAIYNRAAGAPSGV